MSTENEHHALPSAKKGNPMGLQPILVSHIVGAAGAYGLYLADLEGLLGDFFSDGVNTEFAQLAVVSSTALCIAYLGSLVNTARAKYDVHWPYHMLNKGDKYAVEYNQVQRAHANFVETAVVAVPLTLATAHLSPIVVLVLSQFWCWLKLGMAVSYAKDGHGNSPIVFVFSYLFYFVLHGMAYLGMAAKLGLINFCGSAE